jgi:hypothetical protein
VLQVVTHSIAHSASGKGDSYGALRYRKLEPHSIAHSTSGKGDSYGALRYRKLEPHSIAHSTSRKGDRIFNIPSVAPDL